MFAKTLSVIAAMLCFSSAVVASSQGELLTDINSDIDLLKAQVERDELRLKRKKINAEMDGSLKESSDKNSLPTEYFVVWVEGIGTKQYAQLISEGGNRYEVRVGDKLPNGARIVKIAPNEVVVEDSAKRHRMLSSAPASITQTPLYGAGVMPSQQFMPPPMTIPPNTSTTSGPRTTSMPR